jgi:hypothetical protein
MRLSLSKEAFDTNRGLWLSTDQNELYPNPHSYATEGERYCPRVRAAIDDSSTPVELVWLCE